MNSIQKSRTFAFLVIAALLSSCSNPESELKKAEQVNTEEAYQDFIQKHPGSVLTARANADLADLIFPACINTNTVRAFQDFIKRFPNTNAGKRAQQCVERLEYTQATNEDTIDMYQSFLGRHPGSEFASQIEKRLNDRVEERDFNKTLLSDKPEDYPAFLSGYPLTKTRDVVYEHLVDALSHQGWTFRLTNRRVPFVGLSNDKILVGGTISYAIAGSVLGNDMTTTLFGTVNRSVEPGIAVFTDANSNLFIHTPVLRGPIPCLDTNYVPTFLFFSNQSAAFYEFCRLALYVDVGRAVKKSRRDVSSESEQNWFCSVASSLQHPATLEILKDLREKGTPSVASNAEAAIAKWSEIHDYVKQIAHQKR